MTTQGWTRPRNVFFYRIGISKKILYMKSNVENDKCEFHRQHFVNGKIGVFFSPSHHETVGLFLLLLVKLLLSTSGIMQMIKKEKQKIKCLLFGKKKMRSKLTFPEDPEMRSRPRQLPLVLLEPQSSDCLMQLQGNG